MAHADIEKKHTGKVKKTFIYVLVLVLIAIVFGGLFGFNVLRMHFIKKAVSHYRPPPVTISAEKAQTQTWHPRIAAVGTLVAVNGVDVTSETSGIIVHIHFKSGQLVKQGEPLIKLDDTVDQQELKNLQAQLKLAAINFERIQKLYKKRAVSVSQVDTSRAKLQQEQALVAKTQAQINQKTIKAPFAGKLGVRLVNVGEFIKPGIQIVSLQSFDPLYAQFTLPEQYLRNIYIGQPILLNVGTYKNEVFHGKITAINSKVNEKTRNILVQATVPNDEQRLYPGLFANVKVILPQQHNVVTIPQTAISYSLYGDAVYVVKASKKDQQGKSTLHAYRQFVRIGARRGSVIAIKEGLKAGQTVITSGQLKLTPGTQVVINNSAEKK